MLNKIINYLKKIKIFTTSYSLNVFDSPLSKGDEQMYIERHLKGDKDARNKLIEHNLRLVAHIVKKYESKGNTDDLISIGTIGLIKGIDSYRPQKKVKLTTYAAKCAENEILMYFRSNKKYNNNISLNDVIGHDKDGGDITLIDVLKEKAEGEAMDLSHGVPYAPSKMEIRAGDYDECKDADIVVITAGINQKPNQTRLELVQTNAKIIKEITENADEYVELAFEKE